MSNTTYTRVLDPENSVPVAADIQTRVPSEPFFYLAGPMTGYPQHNFPAFIAATEALRDAGYVICPPHEMEDQVLYERVMAGSTGHEEDIASQSPTGFGLLRRDANIVMHPNCVGVIALDGWEDSFGAGQIEVYLADRFRKQTLYFNEDAGLKPHGFRLVEFSYSIEMSKKRARDTFAQGAAALRERVASLAFSDGPEPTEDSLRRESKTIDPDLVREMRQRVA